MSQQSDKQPYAAYIRFDDAARTFTPADTQDVYAYDDIADVEYVEEHGSMGRGGIARAFSASFFGERRGVFIASEMAVVIQLKNGREVLLRLLKTPMKSNTLMYRLLKEQADALLAKLRAVQPQVEQAEQPDEDEYMHELRKLKRLVDEGVITEQEFGLKKKQILGI